jgi:signal transduction histidine kinase
MGDVDIRAGLRAVGAGAVAAGLAVTNLPIFVLFVAGLVLSAVPGALPAATRLVRARADLQRRLGSQSGTLIGRPYRPVPERSPVLGWRQVQWILTDPATWRDLAWLIPGAVVGLGLGLIAIAFVVVAVAGIALIPLWLWLGDVWFGYGLFWPVTSLTEAALSLPQGLVVLAAGLSVAPWLRWLTVHFDRLLLAPTRNARLLLRVTQLTVTRADTVDAQAAELRRIERDLHDGAQARLVSVGMAIGLAEEMLERDPAAARRLLAEARESSGAALVELRHLVRGIHPPVLAERGLEGAIRALALSLPVPTTVDGTLSGRLDTPVESAAYFAVAEILANVTRHSSARTAEVRLRHHDGVLVVRVSDDGAGGAEPGAGTGLRGIERRLAAFDGTMTVSSPRGGPTVVTMEVPCALSSPKTTPSSATE